MKQLLIIRHAKSDWSNPMHSDFERTLNDRGNRDAPMMAKRIKDEGITIDLFVSSTATRALTTAIYFAKAFERKEKDILKLDELYHAAPKIFYSTIEALNNEFNSVAIFSHNPGITDFVNSLTNTRIDNMPTCAVFAIKIDTKSWEDFALSKKDFWFFDYPKSIL